jgi:lysophospholipase L1-like esterase
MTVTAARAFSAARALLPVLFWLYTPSLSGQQPTSPATPATSGTSATATQPQPTADEVARRRAAQDEKLRTDWPDLAKYRDANAKLTPPVKNEDRVVFMGNSITEGWARYFPSMFPGKPYIGRGISGQTTPQMLVRFQQDVVALKPKVVVILAGTNDIAGNTGPSTPEMIENNIASMAEIAQANGIRVVLSSILPVYDYPWRPGLEPAPKIIAINNWMKDWATRHNAVYLDYHSAMADERGGMREGLASDGVHPTEAGYRVMAPLAEQAIRKALRIR